MQSTSSAPEPEPLLPPGIPMNVWGASNWNQRQWDTANFFFFFLGGGGGLIFYMLCTKFRSMKHAVLLEGTKTQPVQSELHLWPQLSYYALKGLTCQALVVSFHSLTSVITCWKKKWAWHRWAYPFWVRPSGFTPEHMTQIGRSQSKLQSRCRWHVNGSMDIRWLAPN